MPSFAEIESSRRDEQAMLRAAASRLPSINAKSRNVLLSSEDTVELLAPMDVQATTAPEFCMATFKEEIRIMLKEHRMMMCKAMADLKNEHTTVKMNVLPGTPSFDDLDHDIEYSTR